MHRRTALITAASIAAVVLTGATAVGANIGILTSAGGSDIGGLTAVTQVATVEPVAATPTAVPAAIASVVADGGMAMTSQVFQADAAGQVEVQFGPERVRLGTIDATAGWTWSSEQRSDTELAVIFVSDEGAEFDFFAELLPDGSLTAKVDETIVQTIQADAEVITVHQQAPTPTPVAAQPPAAIGTSTPGVAASPVPASGSAVYASSDEDEYEYDDDHDDDDEDDEYEYEGADDDD